MFQFLLVLIIAVSSFILGMLIEKKRAEITGAVKKSPTIPTPPPAPPKIAPAKVSPKATAPKATPKKEAVKGPGWSKTIPVDPPPPPAKKAAPAKLPTLPPLPPLNLQTPAANGHGGIPPRKTIRGIPIATIGTGKN